MPVGIKEAIASTVDEKSEAHTSNARPVITDNLTVIKITLLSEKAAECLLLLKWRILLGQGEQIALPPAI